MRARPTETQCIRVFSDAISRDRSSVTPVPCGSCFITEAAAINAIKRGEKRHQVALDQAVAEFGLGREMSVWFVMSGEGSIKIDAIKFLQSASVGKETRILNN